eukprot:TRINITY_DN6711_c0_g1_i1.p1 TRINITY_DN6711_c0_g1~~TRINITY_DN6711_c0_g1_i1.p1  ORF type:complete len:242 (-),score=57.22 TRINITY_DN6711_c0_g1_i1:260-985(-)
MAFVNRVGLVLRQSFSKGLGSNDSKQASAMFNALRFMSSSRLFIGGLSYGMDEQALRESFAEFGEITEARIINDRETGRSRGFGFVSFVTEEEANAAKASMDGKQLYGRFIRVDYASERPATFRPASGYAAGYGGAGYGRPGGYQQGGSYGNTGSYGQGNPYGGIGQSGGPGYAGSDAFNQNNAFGANAGYGQNPNESSIQSDNLHGSSPGFGGIEEPGNVETTPEGHTDDVDNKVGSVGK